MKFPITRKQFYDWLRANPKKMIGGVAMCPLEKASWELAGESITVGFAQFGEQTPHGSRGRLPRWALKVRRISDEMPKGWKKTPREILLKALEESK